MNNYNLDFAVQFTMPAHGHNIDMAIADTRAIASELTHLLFMLRFEKDEAKLKDLANDLMNLVKNHDIMVGDFAYEV